MAVGKEVLKTIITLITTAFALVAGLAWNDAIQALINTFMESGSALTGQIVYAVIVTIIAVIVTLLLGRAAGRAGIELDE
ncbi:MAG: DUF5654 family protein [archaeon]|nr:DUF5654 family protein [archaeon]